METEKGYKPVGELNEEEALVYQTYATQKDNKEFSEKPEDMAEIEADILIRRLREYKVDWAGIDISTLDFRDAQACGDFIRRLELAVDYLMEMEKQLDQTEGVYIQDVGLILDRARREMYEDKTDPMDFSRKERLFLSLMAIAVIAINTAILHTEHKEGVRNYISSQEKQEKDGIGILNPIHPLSPLNPASPTKRLFRFID